MKWQYNGRLQRSELEQTLVQQMGVTVLLASPAFLIRVTAASARSPSFLLLWHLYLHTVEPAPGIGRTPNIIDQVRATFDQIHTRRAEIRCPYQTRQAVAHRDQCTEDRFAVCGGRSGNVLLPRLMSVSVFVRQRGGFVIATRQTQEDGVLIQPRIRYRNWGRRSHQLRPLRKQRMITGN